MSDLQDTLNAIDQLAVHECAHCQRQLPPDSVSLDFCSPWCQSSWLAAKQEIIELVGYQEPDDLPVYVDNLTELRSPETTPLTENLLDQAGERSQLVRWTLESNPSLRASAARLINALDGWWIEYAEQIEPLRRRIEAGYAVIFDELRPFGVVINSRRITEPEPEPEPEPDKPPFGSDFDFEQTPAKSLPHEPPPAVMPAVPAQDWQALIDSQSGSYRAPDRFRRPFGRSQR